MSFITDARDDLENVGAIAAAPFTFGQAGKLTSNSAQNSGFGNFTQNYSDLWRDADIAGLVAGGAYLGAEALAAPGAAGTSGVVTPAAAAETPTTTSTLAQGVLQGGETTAAVPTTAPAALSDTAAASAPAATNTATTAAPYVDSATGTVVTPGPGSVGPMDPSAAGAVTQAGDWIQAHPIASIIGANMLGGALTGYANRQAQLEAIEKKKQAELELADLPRRQKMGNPSVGGKGVDIRIKPGTGTLMRKDGTPVYIPGTGIINSAMNGTRG